MFRALMPEAPVDMNSHLPTSERYVSRAPRARKGAKVDPESQSEPLQLPADGHLWLGPGGALRCEPTGDGARRRGRSTSPLRQLPAPQEFGRQDPAMLDARCDSNRAEHMQPQRAT